MHSGVSTPVHPPRSRVCANDIRTFETCTGKTVGGIGAFRGLDALGAGAAGLDPPARRGVVPPPPAPAGHGGPSHKYFHFPMCALMGSDLFGHGDRLLPAGAKADVLRLGAAGEMLVLAKLMLWGFDAFQVHRDGAYDIGVDLGGRLVRIQVKSKSRPNTCAGRTSNTWSFSPRRAGGALVERLYAASAYDVAAFVALSLERVLFASGVTHSWSSSTKDFLTEGAELNSWREALNSFNKGKD